MNKLMGATGLFVISIFSLQVALAQDENKQSTDPDKDGNGTLSIQEVVGYTIQTSPDVNAAAAERRAVAKQVEQAEAGYYPRVDFDAGYGYQETNSPITRSRGDGSWKHSRKEVGLLLDQMIFDGFLTKNEVLRQEARTNSRAYRVYSQAEIDALEASRAYINLIRRDELVSLAEENLDIHKRVNKQIKLRHEQGVGRQSELEQSEARLSRAETNLIAEKGNYQDAVANFVRVVGIPPMELAEPYTPYDELPNSLDSSLQTARDTHPTIKSAMADLNSAYAQKESAKSSMYPRLNLEVGARHDDDINGIAGEDEEFSVMLRLRYNLFNGGEDMARIDETTHLISQAQNIRDSAIRQVEQSVRLSWDAYQTTTRQVKFFKSNRDATMKAYSAYKQQFSLGQRTLLDLLDSANEMFVAKSDYVNTRYDRILSMYRVFASMGLLHKTFENDLPPETELIAMDNMPFMEEKANDAVAEEE